MKTLIITLLLWPVFLNAQINFPPASPDASWMHQLGFTQISLTYSRPQMRGRQIFGQLVPYKELWRTGAGESTRITFSEDIIFGGEYLKKGKYAIYSIPGPDEWIIILNEDATLHGDFGYDEKKDILRIKVKPQTMTKQQESFTIELVDFKPDYSAILEMKWENTSVGISIKSTADDKIMADIKEALLIKNSDNPGLLNKGAQYYFTQNKDLEQALSWSMQSETLVPGSFNYVYLTTKILEAMKRYPEAIKSAEKAIEFGKTDKPAEVNILKSKIEEWKHHLGKTKN